MEVRGRLWSGDVGRSIAASERRAEVEDQLEKRAQRSRVNARGSAGASRQAQSRMVGVSRGKPGSPAFDIYVYK